MAYLYKSSPVYAKKPHTQTQGTTALISKAVQPNSAIAALLDHTDQYNHSSLDTAMQARLAALRGQRPAAEQEADRLSIGTTARTPDQLKLEMGRRLSANFSSVRFHSDEQSMQTGNLIGARAWTQGRDVYFGQGGFDPDIAAHELVHTVQQGVIAGNVSETAPVGDIQMCPLPVLRSTASKRKTRIAPYEITSEQLRKNQFNPGNIPEIDKVQEEINQAKTIKDAYKAFYAFSNPDPGSIHPPKPLYDIEDEKGTHNLNLNLFKAKLKNMTRIVYDYPELKGRIGTFHFDYCPPSSGHAFLMKTTLPTVLSNDKLVSDLTYNTYFDQKVPTGKDVTRQHDPSYLTADRSYSGVHELAHILNYLLALSRYSAKAAEQILPLPPVALPPLTSTSPAKDRDKPLDLPSKGNTISAWAHQDTMKSMKTSGLCSQALVNVKAIPPESKKNPQQINAALKNTGITSSYGRTAPVEFFAEAFADVYAHGDQAFPASIELVKQYEVTREKYKAKRLNSFCQKWNLNTPK